MNHTITILEGPDGSGKSTLAKRQDKHSSYIHGGSKRDTVSEQIDCAVAQLRAAAQLAKWEPVTIDRSVLSIIAYECALGNYEELKENEAKLKSAVREMNKYRVIICLPTKAKWLEVFKREKTVKGEFYTSEEFMGCVYDEFKKLLDANPEYERYNYCNN